jgi:hypothetical protein
MNEMVKAPAPVHLWIVGLLALLWNGFGCFDYFMTRTRGAGYIESMMPGADGDAFMAYINGFPAWASAGWALGVWGGLAGAVLLLARSHHAVLALGLSLAGALIGIVYQLMNPIGLPEATQGVNGIMPYIIIAIAAALFLYARAMRAKGVLG